MYSRGESEKINVKKWTTQLPNIVDESLNCVEAPIYRKSRRYILKSADKCSNSADILVSNKKTTASSSRFFIRIEFSFLRSLLVR